MTRSPRRVSRGGRRARFVWSVALPAAGVAVLALVLGYGLTGCKGKTASSATTFVARRGTLPITVTEGGSVDALERQEVKSEIRGMTKILSIVDEGYQVTEEDVKNGKILVELDDSDLEQRLTQQEIQYQSALSAYADAKTSYEIQIKQNESDIKSAELEVKFARMDFEKYLGEDLADEIIRKLGLDVVAEEAFKEIDYGDPLAETDSELTDSIASKAEPVPAQPATGGPDAEQMMAKLEELGFDVDELKAPEGSPMPIDPAKLMQQAKEKGIDLSALRALMPQGERRPPMPGGTPAGAGPGRRMGPPAQPTPPAQPQPAESRAPGTRPDVEIGLVASSIRDRIDFSQFVDAPTLAGEALQKIWNYQSDIYLATEELNLATTRRDGTKKLLEQEFVTQNDLDTDEMTVKRREVSKKSYETSQELFRRYEFPKTAEQLLSKYEEALRKLERTKKQAVARMAKADASLNSSWAKLELQRRERDECLEQIAKCRIAAERTGLVVYAGSNDPFRAQQRIEEGAQVHERQVIIVIPDMKKMGVKVGIPESEMQRIHEGQQARITLDSRPGEVLHGKVTKLSILPDAGRRWMNPDQKVYTTEISIEGTYDWLKPGMTAQVEIMVTELEDVVYVPIQAVVPSGDERVVYVVNGKDTERRVVQTGDFNDDFVAILAGLEEGERVLLAPPEELVTDEPELEEELVASAGSESTG